ncbi:putative EG45-like domain containing protein 1 [Coffea arabica]|uniref:EG45-like domain containing protein 1 n=1 Tax=Coffea arabica TaxID=13443 RepID=A0A6P6WWD5_COFAR|nr:putative EG45-like domain containing protein 1 [Coffea arabica]
MTTKNLHALVVFGFVLGLVSPSLATKGTAVYFTRYYPNACYKLPTGIKFVSLSDQYWDGGARCDKRYNVTCIGPRSQGSATPCTGESVVVRTIDHCVDCEQSIVLSKEAFTIIADPEAGTIDVEFTLLD